MSSDEESLGPPIKPTSGDVSDAADFPKSVRLNDGTEVPVGLPPGVDQEQAKLAIEYLKQNPVLAKNAVRQAQKLAQTPGMSQQFAQMQHAMVSNEEYQKRMALLRDDPELKPIFDEIAGQGMDAIDRYWNDMDLMSKISQRMEAMKIDAQPNRKPMKIKNLHDAAKMGDLEELEKRIEKRQDVNEQDGRGITPLGVAVGFNRVKAVEFLLQKGANVNLTDKKGNTVLHYAAGYGRLESAQMLLAAGANPSSLNNDKQTPLDVATVNGEAGLIDFLRDRIESQETDT